MNDYNDLMNEYEDIKKDISDELNTISNAILRVKTFQCGLELFVNNILMIKGQKTKFSGVMDADVEDFSKKLGSAKNYIENEVSCPLKSLLDGANDVSHKNLDTFNNIKISLIQERQKMNKSKEDYFNFITQRTNQNQQNEDETILYNAKKDNFFQMYKYQVNQMNVTIDENNIVYKNMYNELNSWKMIQKAKIKIYLENFCKYIEKIGNLFIDYSKNLSKALKETKEFNEINALNNNKEPRFEKVVIEEIKDNIIEEEKKQENIDGDNSKNNNKIKDDFFDDFDIIEKDNTNANNAKEPKENTIKQIKNKGKKLSFSLIDKIKGLKKGEKKEKELEIKKPSHSSGLNDEFELVENNIISDDKNYQEIKEKKLDEIINKIISKDELSSQDISQLMILLKEENTSTKKLYSHTFLTKLNKMNKKYIINLDNRKNFMHLSNIINAIAINDNNIDILKLIIEISQMIIYKDLYLFNILRKKNQYLSTKSFWSKLIMDFFINDLNNQAKIILSNQKNSKDTFHVEKSKDTNIFLLEYIKLSNQITKYKKLNTEQKIRLDEYARRNISVVLTKVIEGMCSFYVKKNIIIDVITDFGKIFGFNQEDNDYYNLLSEAYLNRNYIYNLKQLSLKEKSEEKISKICIISNAAKFLPKDNFMNLLHLEKCMTEQIKKNIFKNYLSENISINERTRLWGLMLGVDEVKKDYNYTEILNGIVKSLENMEIKPDSEMAKNIEMITLDVNRTFFKDKSDYINQQKSLKNILMCLVHIFSNVGYFQGMNYIAGFLYQILNFDEEKTFYYMLAIQKNTMFKNIFVNNLSLLQSFFEVFKKILKIYIPEIYQHQKNNEISENYYMPPWFLTLFMFSATIFDVDDAPKFIFLIIEDFFLNGWSAIFNAGYTVIKYHKSEIIKLKTDRLLHYLVNNFGRDDAINENFESIKKEYIKNSYQINEELISKLLRIVKYEEAKKINNE